MALAMYCGVDCLDFKQSMEYSLLWRASKDGFEWNDFYGKCNGKRNTLIIIQSKLNNVFGGFTSVEWSRMPKYRYDDDPKAFIYLIRSNQGLESKLYPAKYDGDGVIYQCATNIFVFGNGGRVQWY